MKNIEVAYLGPPGTYSHLVAEKYYGPKCQYVPFTTILAVCNYVSKHPNRRGIVPIENSSGGSIHETVDILLANKPHINIEKELSLDVKLALIGRKNENISVLYSHFAPIEHCVTWLRKHLPKAKRQIVTSTAVAAQRASTERNAGALGSKKLATLYNLDILNYPVEADIANITTFLAITGGKTKPINPSKTMIAARLPNKPGGLFKFLEAFNNENVNLSRLISRPIRGVHKEYAFLVDIDAGTNDPNVKKALTAARKTCVHLHVAGSFPVNRKYKS